MDRGAPRVHLIPYWPANPYQPQLVDGLRGLGLRVETETLLKSLGRTRTDGRDDLLHLHWLPVAGPGPARLARWWLFARRVSTLKASGVPVVWTAHNVVPHESSLAAMDLWMSRTIARLASRIICHSAGAREELITRLQTVDAARIRVIPHGHYIEAYPNTVPPAACRAQLDLPPDATVFLSIGAIRPYKGVLELVEAFRALEAPQARLLIAGKPHGSAIDEAVKARIGQDSRITYVAGRVADANLQVYFNASDAVVFPYRKSLTSGALVLAMSFGRACIAPRLPGMADCLSERGGILYDANDGGGLRAALSAAIERRAALPAMGAVNLDRARDWDWKTIAGATADCYSEAIDVAASAPSRSGAGDPGRKELQ